MTKKKGEELKEQETKRKPKLIKGKAKDNSQKTLYRSFN